MKNYLEILGNMKDLKRTGWLKRKVSNPESVADHTFGVTFLVYLLCPDTLNKQRCLELALVHDLAEIITGDFTPCDNIAPETKSANEILAMKEIADKLGKPELLDLFVEYEEKQSEEAKFVTQVDKVECVMQAKYYDQNNRAGLYKEPYTTLFDEFKDTAKGKIEMVLELLKATK